MKLRFIFGQVECVAELDEKKAPLTIEAIAKELPIKSVANRWGDEIYFETPVRLSVEENSKDVVEEGDVAFWIPGRAICIFFGKTPISDDKIRPASAVNVIGKVKEGLDLLKNVRTGTKVIVQAE
ncbi:cyclophilin-like fold protein [Thermotoga caldifontis]|uniref:cyclophilin-like fold protein n=1 Tax=Thermotoga caldifontis TaxID=1508419 RepID=UPI000596D528|nr:cyclophilin-like fold protein [Thermotoga caldifontis]